MKCASHIARGSRIHAKAHKYADKLTSAQRFVSTWEKRSHAYVHHFILVISVFPFGIEPVHGQTINITVQGELEKYGISAKTWINSIETAIVNGEHITEMEGKLGMY